MKPMRTIFTVPEQFTQNQVSEIYERQTPQQSQVFSIRQSSNTSFMNINININIVRIGLQKLNRVFKVKGRHLKRNAIEAIREVSTLIKESREERIQKLKQQSLKQNTSFQRSNSFSKIELLNDIVYKLQKNHTKKASFLKEEHTKDRNLSKNSIKDIQKNQRMSTKQSTVKKAPQGMYFKRLRQNIMNIKTQLNYVQKINEDLRLQNKRLTYRQHSQSMASLHNHTPSICHQTPIFYCVDCATQIILPMHRIHHYPSCVCHRFHL